MDQLVADIRMLAAMRHDNETCRDADQVNVLLRNLATEIWIEDQRGVDQE